MNTLFFLAPLSAVSYFGGYEFSKYLFFSHSETLRLSDTTVFIFSAWSAEILSLLARNPFEIVKQQMQVGYHSGVLPAFKRVLELRGPRGLFTGIGLSMMRDIPFGSIQLPVYEKLKQSWGRPYSQLNFFQLVSCSFVAGGIAAFFTTPLDVLRTRTMVSQKSEKMTIRQNAISLYNEYGIMGFMKGAKERTMMLSTGGIIYFGLFEYSRKFYSKVF